MTLRQWLHIALPFLQLFLPRQWVGWGETPLVTEQKSLWLVERKLCSCEACAWWNWKLCICLPFPVFFSGYIGSLLLKSPQISTGKFPMCYNIGSKKKKLSQMACECVCVCVCVCSVGDQTQSLVHARQVLYSELQPILPNGPLLPTCHLYDN
jgi:hypothetical protein